MVYWNLFHLGSKTAEGILALLTKAMQNIRLDKSNGKETVHSKNEKYGPC